MTDHRPLLSVAALRAKLRRELRGTADPLRPTAEHLLVHLVNAGEHEKARELLGSMSDIGPDLAACVNAVLAATSPEGRRDKPYLVSWPPDVWDFYAQTAREQHLTIRTALIEAVRRDRDRIVRARQEVREPRANVLEELREIRKSLDGLRSVPAPNLDGVTGTVAELREHARQQGTALAAILMVLDAKGWIPKRLAQQLRNQKWL